MGQDPVDFSDTAPAGPAIVSCIQWGFVPRLGTPLPLVAECKVLFTDPREQLCCSRQSPLILP